MRRRTASSGLVSRRRTDFIRAVVSGVGLPRAFGDAFDFTAGKCTPMPACVGAVMW